MRAIHLVRWVASFVPYSNLLLLFWPSQNARCMVGVDSSPLPLDGSTHITQTVQGNGPCCWAAAPCSCMHCIIIQKQKLKTEKKKGTETIQVYSHC